MTIDDVADGCQRAIEAIKTGIEATLTARGRFAATASTLAETLTEQSSRYGTMLAPLQKLDAALDDSIRAAHAAIEDIEAYVAFIRGPAGSSPSASPSAQQATTSRDRASTWPRSAPSDSADPGTDLTRPSLAPDPDRLPGGVVSRVRDARTEGDGLRRENTAASVLARAGYIVEQNPPAKPNGRQPDYLIEGRHWDCLSPLTTNGGQIRKRISEKVKKDQADRIIVNLDREDGAPTADVDDIRQGLERRPIAGLKEIKIIADEQVIDFYPW